MFRNKINTKYNQLTADSSALLGTWLVYYCFVEILYLPRSTGFLSLWSKQAQEASAVNELIIQMFTSHVIAFHSPFCLFCIQTLLNVQFSLVWVMGLNILNCKETFMTQKNKHWSDITGKMSQNTFLVLCHTVNIILIHLTDRSPQLWLPTEAHLSLSFIDLQYKKVNVGRWYVLHLNITVLFLLLGHRNQQAAPKADPYVLN